MKIPGVFGLKTPQGLMKKAEHDFVRFSTNPRDVYAAFDFFVTAQNVPEWIYPPDRNKTKLKKIFKDRIHLRVCRHVGNSVKHLELRQGGPNKQVHSTNFTPGAWGDAWGEAWGGSWGRGQLVIVLDPDDPDTATYTATHGSTIRAIDLASKVMDILRQMVP